MIAWCQLNGGHLQPACWLGWKHCVTYRKKIKLHNGLHWLKILFQRDQRSGTCCVLWCVRYLPATSIPWVRLWVGGDWVVTVSGWNTSERLGRNQFQNAHQTQTKFNVTVDHHWITSAKCLNAFSIENNYIIFMIPRTIATSAGSFALRSSNLGSKIS